MDGVLELWEKGQVGLTTLMGMGGVFFALLCLYGFTSALGKVFFRRKPVSPDNTKKNQETTPEGAPRPQTADENEALAAAIAVTWALGSARKVAIQARSGDGANPWRMAGRAAMMRPLRKRGKAAPGVKAGRRLTG